MSSHLAGSLQRAHHLDEVGAEVDEQPPGRVAVDQLPGLGVVGRLGSVVHHALSPIWTANGGPDRQVRHLQPDPGDLRYRGRTAGRGRPAGWLFVDFCANFVKMVGPLQRTCKWDGAKSFGGDSLTDCGGNAKVPDAAVPGFRSTAANVKSGSSFKAFSDLYLSKVGGTTFNSGTSEAFDAVFVSFLAAVSEKSDDPLEDQPGHRQGHQSAWQGLLVYRSARDTAAAAGRDAGPLQRRGRRAELRTGRARDVDRLRHLAGRCRWLGGHSAHDGLQRLAHDGGAAAQCHAPGQPGPWRGCGG